MLYLNNIHSTDKQNHKTVLKELWVYICTEEKRDPFFLLLLISNEIHNNDHVWGKTTQICNRNLHMKQMETFYSTSYWFLNSTELVNAKCWLLVYMIAMWDKVICNTSFRIVTVSDYILFWFTSIMCMDFHHLINQVLIKLCTCNSKSICNCYLECVV